MLDLVSGDLLFLDIFLIVQYPENVFRFINTVMELSIVCSMKTKLIVKVSCVSTNDCNHFASSRLQYYNTLVSLFAQFTVYTCR